MMNKKKQKKIAELWIDIVRDIKRARLDYQSLPRSRADLVAEREAKKLPLAYKGVTYLFTPQQHRVMLCFALRYTNEKAGQIIGVSSRTIESHSDHICSILQCKNKKDLLKIIQKSDFNERYQQQIDDLKQFILKLTEV